jgi:hypothetical protein
MRYLLVLALLLALAVVVAGLDVVLDRISRSTDAG